MDLGDLSQDMEFRVGWIMAAALISTGIVTETLDNVELRLMVQRSSSSTVVECIVFASTEKLGGRLTGYYD